MLERTAVPETSRTAPSTQHEGMPSQLFQFAVIVLGIALITFIMYLYVLPNSQINQARTQIGQLQREKAELLRRNAEVLQEIARYSDLKTLESRARQIGMGPVQSAIYLQIPDAGLGQPSDRQQPADSTGRNANPAPLDRPLTVETIEWQAKQLLNSATQSVDGFFSRLLGD